MPLDRKPKFLPANEALESVLKSCMTVFIQGAAATPEPLVEAMCDVAKENCLENIKVCSMDTIGKARYAEKEFKEIFNTYSFFIGDNVRKGIAAGYADSIPINLVDVPALFYQGIFEPDVSLINVSPPDCHGYCSLGTSVDCVRSAIIHSKTIVALINKFMPRTFGDSVIHVSHIDVAVETKVPPLRLDRIRPSPEDLKIGDFIAENLVEDGATLQLGRNGISEAIIADLRCHRNLGIHTEMLTDGIKDLVETGVVTNHKKNIDKGKIVASFMQGNRDLYDYFNNNCYLELKTIDYVNKISVISKMPRMTAINSCISVDLTGQVNSDSIGKRMYSGFGGQFNFIRGSFEGYDGEGKGIIAMHALNKNGDSKIVPLLKQGAGVVTVRAAVQYVVTEYGIAELYGKSLGQRAYALINIAHPNHRGPLMKAAYERLNTVPEP
ncbi:4-hydroxybutyrate coenzyme A transferase [Blattella germanica]|nr:4-hydroxybutyrate coenzyme A transferase [Blattella germanica]